ncbi:MAG: anaerobic ribonucleoside-triphosphate reductase [Candidatus Gracilibacteria bacterium]|nr:anaerobic ribonucleoside-triphosphate reductase [Candidatus Gracilibacteria bacterium]
MPTFIDKDGNEQTRTKCEIYTRVMGYYRPVSQFNNGKKSEFYTREYFSECATENSKFIAEFQTA